MKVFDLTFMSFLLNKKCTKDNMSLVLWQRMKDLNPHKRSQSPVCYHYTNPLNAYAIITILKRLSSRHRIFSE